MERDPSALWVTDIYMRVDADERAWDEARAWIIGTEPAFRLENGLVESFESVDATASWVLLGLLATALITTVAGFVIAVDDLGRRQEWRSLRAVGLARRGLTAVHLLEATVVGGTAMVIAAVAGAAVGAAFLRVGDEPLRAEVYLLSAGAGFLVVVAAAAPTSIVAHRRRWSVE
jgi:hypothetical protein